MVRVFGYEVLTGDALLLGSFIDFGLWPALDMCAPLVKLWGLLLGVAGKQAAEEHSRSGLGLLLKATFLFYENLLGISI